MIKRASCLSRRAQTAQPPAGQLKS